MPILDREPDVFPDDLFANPALGGETDRGWLAIYTLSRREKDLMRRLRAKGISFYSPFIEKKQRSPAGRVRTSYVPLLAGYVFLYGGADDRYAAMTTNCVSRCLDVPDQLTLTFELKNLHRLVSANVPITPESKLQAGDRVRIKSGSLEGLEGIVLKRQNTRRLLVSVDYIQKGASMALDDWEVEPIA